MRAFADAGCRYLQLDEVNFTYLCDPKLRAQVANRGDDPDKLPHVYARTINAAISDIPADMTIAMHLCRGNFQSTFVASAATSRWRKSCSTPSTCTAISWNTTASAPAASSRCAFVPKGKTVVLGLVTSKPAALESHDEPTASHR